MITVASTRWFLLGAAAVIVVLVVVVAPRASDEPDGLERVAIDHGFADAETEHALGDGPGAGYEVSGVDDPAMSTTMAGLVGVAITFAVAGAMAWTVSRRR
ncbi:MAG TPA: PDGLE domain-containing protein [Microthrixaceae bacterium]|nr:PDGLE domain-containing protein [Microthrixaceae bacterium]